LGADFCAVLNLDSQGRVIAANATAAVLWQIGDTELIGESFASLFAFEVVSNDPEFIQAQWEVLRAGLGQEAQFSAQPREGPARDVRVRLEKQIGVNPGYVATIHPPAGTAPAHGEGKSDQAASLRLLMESGPIGYFDLKIADERVFFSPTWKRLLGYAPSELNDSLETWHELIHPDDSTASPHTIGRKVGAGPRPFNVEFRMRHHRGHWVWMQCVGVQIVNSQGDLERVVGAHLDISDRKELEDTLVGNDARLQDLTSGGPLAAFELDFVNLVFWFSPAFERLLGYHEGDLAPHPASFASVLPDEDAPMGTEAWFLSIAPGQSTIAQPMMLRAKDGRPVSVILGAQRSINRKRELVRVVGFACPIPEEAKADPNALPATLVKEAFTALAEAVLISDARGKIIFANANASRLLRVDPLLAPGQALTEVFRLVNRQSNQPGDDPVDRALSTDRPLPLISDDAILTSEKDPPLPIVWTARAVFNAEAKPLGVVVVFRNPDEMTLTPEELVKANRFESLGLLAGGIAHDFNNLLTTILGAVSLARDNRDYSALADAENACMTAKGLTKQLLAFAKGDSGVQTVCAAKEILEHSIKIAAAASNADIELHVADGVDPVLVDRGQIVQVFQNLIVNALQAMPPPPHMPRLQIRAFNVVLGEGQVPGLAPGDYVELEVRDNGSGIKPEHVEKIFDPFFTTKKHGTGLGLATVLSIVRRHGGQIGLETEVGVGTAFAVYLPKADKPLELQARRAASLRFGTGRILFMDDDAKISSLTARMLESLDYKFDLAKDGDEAIALYKRYLNIGRPYDAVIMDLTVVGAMGGEECFAELRKLDPDVRAIVASGYDNDDIARSFLEKGFSGFLAKPYRVTDLGKVLKAVIG
jgi:two-component system cell cycle sensor histidine kinase/response regulator CckA